LANGQCETRPRVTLLAGETKLMSLDYKYFRDGRLVELYPANTLDMQRDHARVVERVRVDGPMGGTEGWLWPAICEAAGRLPFDSGLGLNPWQ